MTMAKQWAMQDLTPEQMERAKAVEKRHRIEVELELQEGLPVDDVVRGLLMLVTGVVAREYGSEATPSLFDAQGKFLRGLMGEAR